MSLQTAEKQEGTLDCDIITFEPEVERGNVEYKWKLVNKSEGRIEQLTTQMNWRLTEGNGRAIYMLGVSDDGTTTGLSEPDRLDSIETLKQMAASLGCDLRVASVFPGKQGDCAKVLVERRGPDALSCSDSSLSPSPLSQDDYGSWRDLHITLVGAPLSGKSSLIGALVAGQLDNGKGRSRLHVFRHPHEVLQGSTTSLSRNTLNLDNNGEIVRLGNSWANLASFSSSDASRIDRRVVVVDTGGNIGTIFRGLCGYDIDYALIALDLAAISSLTELSMDAVIPRVTREHLYTCMALSIPIILTFTKADLVSDALFEKGKHYVVDTLEEMGFTSSDVKETQSSSSLSRHVIPIVSTSAVTGSGLDSLIKLIHGLPFRKDWRPFELLPLHMQIQDVFEVDDMEGFIVAGIIRSGVVTIGVGISIGPFENGEFILANVESIHMQRNSYKQGTAGQSITMMITARDTRESRRLAKPRPGMAILHESEAISARACAYVTAHLRIVDAQNGIISAGWCPVLHIGNASQSAMVTKIAMTTDPMVHQIEFRFAQHPEYVCVHDPVLVREGHIRAIGSIVGLGYMTSSVK